MKRKWANVKCAWTLWVTPEQASLLSPSVTHHIPTRSTSSATFKSYKFHLNPLPPRSRDDKREISWDVIYRYVFILRLTSQFIMLSISRLTAYLGATVATHEGQYHDDVATWNGFPHYWLFVRGIHRWPVDSPHKGLVMQSYGVTNTTAVIPLQDQVCCICESTAHNKIASLNAHA